MNSSKTATGISSLSYDVDAALRQYCLELATKNGERGDDAIDYADRYFNFIQAQKQGTAPATPETDRPNAFDANAGPVPVDPPHIAAIKAAHAEFLKRSVGRDVDYISYKVTVSSKCGTSANVYFTDATGGQSFKV